MDWDLLRDMLDSDFWTLGGTSTFFTNLDDAQEFAEQRVIVPYDGISEAAKIDLLEVSLQTYDDVWKMYWIEGWSGMTSEEEARYGYWLSETEATHMYWFRMLEEVKKTGDPWLIQFFSGQAEISQETIDYIEGGVVRWDYFTDSFKEQQQKIPWTLIIGALALLLWRK